MSKLIRLEKVDKGYLGVTIACPHPECMHIGSMITKAHSKNEHGISRDDLYQNYGAPFKVVGNNYKPRDGQKVFEWGEVKNV